MPQKLAGFGVIQTLLEVFIDKTHNCNYILYQKIILHRSLREYLCRLLFLLLKRSFRLQQPTSPGRARPRREVPLQFFNLIPLVDGTLDRRRIKNLLGPRPGNDFTPSTRTHSPTFPMAHNFVMYPLQGGFTTPQTPPCCKVGKWADLLSARVVEVNSFPKLVHM